MIATAALSGCSGGDADTDNNKHLGIDDAYRLPLEATPAPKMMSCQFPADANLGVVAGSHLPANISWEGYPIGSDASAPATTVNVTDFYDCDGSKGIDGILFDTSQFG